MNFNSFFQNCLEENLKLLGICNETRILRMLESCVLKNRKYMGHMNATWLNLPISV